MLAQAHEAQALAPRAVDGQRRPGSVDPIDPWCKLLPPMDADALRRELKELVISELNLAGKKPEDIDDDAALFGDGQGRASLGLDSLDALQLAMVVEERFGVRIPEGDEARVAFASIAALAAHVAQAKSG
jgi:acyl carrier protein